MKYLKMFNESKEVLYRKVTKQELWDLIETNKPCDIEKRWVDKLFDWFKSKNISFNSRLMTTIATNPYDVPVDRDLNFGTVHGLSYFTYKHWFIIELDDEWFVVLGGTYSVGRVRITQGDYYLCDQFSGLMQLMEDSK